MPPPRWATTLIDKFADHLSAGPLRGFADWGLRWRLGRPRAQASHAARPTLPLRVLNAYRTLGLAPDAGEDAVRSAYRRHMNRIHPDKLTANGASETVLKAALQSTYEIRKAYDLIRKKDR